MELNILKLSLDMKVLQFMNSFGALISFSLVELSLLWNLWSFRGLNIFHITFTFLQWIVCLCNRKKLVKIQKLSLNQSFYYQKKCLLICMYENIFGILSKLLRWKLSEISLFLYALIKFRSFHFFLSFKFLLRNLRFIDTSLESLCWLYVFYKIIQIACVVLFFAW